MKYSVSSKDINKLVKQIISDSDKALLQCGLYLEGKIKEQLQEDSYDTGQLVRSVNTQRLSENKVIVGTNMEYALVREYGRRPGKFPPLQALVGWSARKGIISGGATSRYEDLHYSDRGKVFIIARAIAVKGTKGKHTFETVINREQNNIVDLFTELMGRG